MPKTVFIKGATHGGKAYVKRAPKKAAMAVRRAPPDLDAMLDRLETRSKAAVEQADALLRKVV